MFNSPDAVRIEVAERSKHPAFQAVWVLKQDVRSLIKGDKRLEMLIKLDQIEESLKMWQPKPKKYRTVD